MAELIVALDLDSGDEAMAMVDQLPGLEWVKIGPVLFVKEGPAILQRLKQRGIRMFLDLKWHDIPNTVAKAARAASDQGVDLATVHALGGGEMIRAAVDASGDMKLVAVTVLTSHSRAEYWATLGAAGGEIGPEAVRLARLAVEAGVHGVVTSPLEVSDVRQAVGPESWIVVPGIRPIGAVQGDQRRVADPGSAVKAGATHLVVGRPITRAKRPAEVYQNIRREMR